MRILRRWINNAYAVLIKDGGQLRGQTLELFWFPGGDLEHQAVFALSP
ncbi:hypothetical protein IWX87_002325 [Polaromonas sp. CG_9.7]|nr:hypothetical protein [Polaromonas sp. CG_9.7]MBG6114719.1 hypothetical protein [Polaromonas sp. CG_9.2]MDH6185117.1 hypothetical protein [Polaromonas sp. CG_23.6]